MKRDFFLFFSIFIEGYIVLACEILAIRVLMPFIGSGVESTAIIIGFVLLPLAAGYHIGGHYHARACKKYKNKKRFKVSVRRKLLRNFITAQIFFTFGLSIAFLELFFYGLETLGLSPLIQTTIYSAFFLTVPVFLLGQTVPLISHYFLRQKLSETTGKILFYSTIGSFTGSIISTLIIMKFFGVTITVIFTLSLITLLCFLVTRRGANITLLASSVIMIVGAFYANTGMNNVQNIISDNTYNTVSVHNNKEASYLIINNSFSSKITKDKKRFHDYINYLNDNFINHVANTPDHIRKFLILGAGGFTIGYTDHTNNYTFVDIDGDLKRIAENNFLPEKLTPNKKLVAESARSFIRHDKELYDFILLDVFTHQLSIPMECTSREFLLQLKHHLKPDGILAANILADPFFRDKYSVRINNTFASVFPSFSRTPIGPILNPYSNQEMPYRNLIYVYFNNELSTKDDVIYTDNKNTSSMDW